MVSHQISSYCIILYFHIYLSWRAGSLNVALYMYSKYFYFDFRIRNTFVLFYSICIAWAPAACTLQYTYIIIYRYYMEAVCVCVFVHQCSHASYIIYMYIYADVCWRMLTYADSLALQQKYSGRSWVYEPVLYRHGNVYATICHTIAPAVTRSDVLVRWWRATCYRRSLSLSLLLSLSLQASYLRTITGWLLASWDLLKAGWDLHGCHHQPKNPMGMCGRSPSSI